MVRSMVSGISGLRTHQNKLDVIGNNIANVNTWGFKSFSVNFQDSMYSNSINGGRGNGLAGGLGGRNSSQVGYGTELGSITTTFETGAPSPSANPMDCMIDGTGFFLVGSMVNGSFTDVASSGLSLSRVGIFRVDGTNGYLVDDQGNYVYGYGLVEGTGIPETPAVAEKVSVKDAPVTVEEQDDGTFNVTIGGQTVEGIKSKDFDKQINEWMKGVTKKDGALSGYNISLTDYNDGVDPKTVNLEFTAKKAGIPDYTQPGTPSIPGLFPGISEVTQAGAARIPGVPAEYTDELSAIQIPIDPDTGLQYDIQSYKINDDGTIVGTDKQNRSIAIGQLALITVRNPSGLDKTDGHYYSIGPNAGAVNAVKPGTGPAGTILGGYLEMANVDLANEFTQMITTQRGYQANSKIITVTDQMLEELVNLKR